MESNALSDIDEADLRVDVFTLAVPLNRYDQHSWPSVRVTHIPTGLVETDQSTGSQLRNRAAALKRLAERIDAGTGSGRP
jgi:protein subunit release factor A